VFGRDFQPLKPIIFPCRNKRLSVRAKATFLKMVEISKAFFLAGAGNIESRPFDC